MASAQTMSSLAHLSPGLRAFPISPPAEDSLPLGRPGRPCAAPRPLARPVAVARGARTVSRSQGTSRTGTGRGGTRSSSTSRTRTRTRTVGLSLWGRSYPDEGAGSRSGTQRVLRRQERRGDGDGDGEGEGSRGRGYFNVTGFPFPLSPFLERKTLRTEIERGRIWAFEQEQGLGFSSVTTNIRMTVIRLNSGGLWVHSPIAPTQELLALLRELDAPVEHIVLPTFAYEHKVFVGPFSRRFPRAKVWTAPLQWSWPLNLPPQLFGIFPSGTLTEEQGQGEGEGSPSPPWRDEIDYKVLATPEVGIGPYVEVAFFHRATRTLLLTDAVVEVPVAPPPVVSSSSLLASAENGLAVRVLSAGQGVQVPEVQVEDTPQFRTLGWQRMVLQILYFGPSNLLEPQESFSAVAGRLIVSPVVKTLVFDKVAPQALSWIDSICSDWSFTRIIPCHFSAPIKASPADLRAIFQGLLGGAVPKPLGQGEGEAAAEPQGFFSFLKGALPMPLPLALGPRVPTFPEEDLRTLRSLDSTLVSLGAVKRTGT